MNRVREWREIGSICHSRCFVVSVDVVVSTESITIGWCIQRETFDRRPKRFVNVSHYRLPTDWSTILFFGWTFLILCMRRRCDAWVLSTMGPVYLSIGQHIFSSAYLFHNHLLYVKENTGVSNVHVHYLFEYNPNGQCEQQCELVRIATDVNFLRPHMRVCSFSKSKP